MLAIEILDGPWIDGFLPDAPLSASYSAQLFARNARPVVSWSIAAGALPAGWTLDDATGEVSGTTAVAGTYSVTIQLTDGLGLTTARTFRFRVAAAPLEVTGADPEAEEGEASEHRLTIAGGVAPYSIAATSGWPAGTTITVDGDEVVIDSNYTKGVAAGSPYAVSVTVEDADGTTSTWVGSLAVEAIPLDYSTFDPANKGASVTLSNGNRDATRGTGTGWQTVKSTSPKSSGKYYAEFQILTIPGSGTIEGPMVGVCTATYTTTDYLGSTATNGPGAAFQTRNATNLLAVLRVSGSNTFLKEFPNKLCSVAIAIDIDAGKCWLGTSASPEGSFAVSSADIAAGLSPTFTFTPGTTMHLAASVSRSTHSCRINTGQEAFTHTAPSGFGAWAD